MNTSKTETKVSRTRITVSNRFIAEQSFEECDDERAKRLSKSVSEKSLLFCQTLCHSTIHLRVNTGTSTQTAGLEVMQPPTFVQNSEMQYHSRERRSLRGSQS